jgi:phosphoenolpyruvate carboxykinase (ATP)
MQDGAIDTLSPRENIAIGEARLWRNFDARTLYQLALRRGEGRLTRDGAIVVDTGEHTGRSPKDKYIVRDETTEENVDWRTNAGLSRAAFDRLKHDVLQHVQGRQLFVQELFAGADPAHQIEVCVYTELAWHALFIRNLLIREAPLVAGRGRLTILAVPSFRADPQRYGVRSATVIACDFSEGLVIIAGTSYAGEMKKAVFTYLNYLLPERGVMPMHCSANVGKGGDVAIFFGLSGTGKTTLSASADRTLIGDDEHGWSREGVFNFEGGCYAKAINLSFASEPQIYSASNRFGAVLENVAVSDITGEPNFHDASRTENTRAAYPLDFIANASQTGRAGHPKNIVMLAADAFGVLPPIARLTPEQAIYHFLSGFTAKVSGTEKGVRDPEPTFSTCFGAPFMPRAAIEYGALLGDLVRQHGVNCWLVNTGWSGGPFGVGKRMRLDWTRAILDAALSGALDSVAYRKDERFGFEVPLSVPEVPQRVLDPRGTWADGDAYDHQARRLAKMFGDNFAKFADHVDPSVRDAGPRLML